MFPIGKQFRRLARAEEGLSSTEYAVMLALIIIVCISAVQTVGRLCDRSFENISQRIR